jgi:apolipoprotein N-acyltransferase
VNFALAILTGVLLILTFPNVNLTWLAPIALTPLLIACARETSWKRRFFQGWLAGFVFWFGVCNWIQFVLEVHGGMGRWGGWATFVLFAVLKGLQAAIFAALAGVLMRNWWAIPAVAALWAGIERTHGPAGFAWLDLGNAGIDMPVLMRLAPFTGVYGLSFVFTMCACAIALVMLRRPRRELAWLLALPLLFALPTAPATVQGNEHALLVQPNIDTEMEWTQASLAQVEHSLAAFSQSQPTHFVIWPEVPAPFYPNEPEFRAYVESIALRTHAYFLFGGVAYNSARSPLNSAFLMDPSGQMIGRYDKIKLVPFGEYVPAIFGWVNRISKEIGDFVPGERVIDFPLAGHQIGAFICYESAFPDLVREFAAGGAGVLINVSNDGYFGHTAAREQHLELVRMRAAENHRWILRATNDGITATVDPAGRVPFRAPPYQLLSADVPYEYRQDITPYTKHGDAFAWTCLIASLALVLFAFIRVHERPIPNYVESPAHRHP